MAGWSSHDTPDLAPQKTTLRRFFLLGAQIVHQAGQFAFFRRFGLGFLAFAIVGRGRLRRRPPSEEAASSGVT